LQLSYIGQDIRRIPKVFEKIYGPKAQKLDLSFNAIDSLQGIEYFTSLEELILDNNLLDDSTQFPFNPLLHTLSLNKNKVSKNFYEIFKYCVIFLDKYINYINLLKTKSNA
jgi:hypothetical protein